MEYALWAGAVSLALGLATVFVLDRLWPEHEAASRLRTLDGLRGYLAFGVFVHHSTIWSTYRVDGVWTSPRSTFYANLGQAAVALFFMITAYLFYSRVMNARTRPIDWHQLYVSRVLRIMPAYLLAVLVTVFVAFASAGFVMRVSGSELLGSIAIRLGMSLFPEPDINGLVQSKLVLAGVVWSLAYEWMFYLALPLIAVATHKARPSLALLASALMLPLLINWHPKLALVAPFLGGIIAAHVLRSERVKRFATTWPASLLATACLLVALFVFNGTFRPVPLLLLTVFFILVTGGNSLFGVLTTRLSVAFGAATYSTYLLHGALLFITFRLLMTPDTAAALTPIQHWKIVWLLSPAVVIVSWLSYRFVEVPGIRLAASLAGKRSERLTAVAAANASH